MTNKQKVVLVVEDHELMRNTLADELQRTLPDCCVMRCATGEEGIALTKKHLPEVVVMDVGLPGIDGIEATRRIKDFRATTTVIVCSLLNALANRFAAMEAGASQWVMKEHALDCLVPAVRRHLTSDTGVSKYARDAAGRTIPLVVAMEEEDRLIA